MKTQVRIANNAGRQDIRIDVTREEIPGLVVVLEASDTKFARDLLAEIDTLQVVEWRRARSH